jgi:hypothetical protein
VTTNHLSVYAMYPSYYYIEIEAAPTLSGADGADLPQPLVECLDITLTANTLPCSPSLPILDKYRLVFESFMSGENVDKFTAIVKALHNSNVCVFNDTNRLLIQLAPSELQRILHLTRPLRPPSKSTYKRKRTLTQRH